jgi:hypothetical protein
LPNSGIEIENAIAGAMLTQAIKLVRALRSSEMSGSAAVISELGKLTAATPTIAVRNTYRRC